MSVHKKLMEARLMLQETKLTKSGLNKFAGYSYFELADFIPATQKIFGDLGLCGVVSYTAEIAQLTITDIETDKSIVITSPMEGANLKGCHPIQNLGAVETYQRRYLWVTAMEILEHDALDSSDGVKEEKTAEVKVITADQATSIKDALSETKSDVPVFLSLFGVGIDSVEKIPARMYTKAKTMLDKKKAEITRKTIMEDIPQ